MSLPRPSSGLCPAAAQPGEFSTDERALLLRLAHDSILSALDLTGTDLSLSNLPGTDLAGTDLRETDQRKIPHGPPSAHLAEPRGVFTSLYLRGELRGCVGYVLPVNPVYRAVAETARAAAFEDERFPPVTREQAPHLEVELSILSPPQPISPDAIEIGRHGVLITMAGQRGLLLPQVPVEHNWNSVTFLEQTCRKAGLPLDAWKKGATVEAFTAEVFGDG
jgi:uncharacterized protein